MTLVENTRMGVHDWLVEQRITLNERVVATEMTEIFKIFGSCPQEYVVIQQSNKRLNGCEGIGIYRIKDISFWE